MGWLALSKFSQRLRLLREDQDLKNKDFARAMNVEPATVSNWENGNRFPKDDLLIKIADYFNCSVDYLLGRTDNREFHPINTLIKDTVVEIKIGNDYSERLTSSEIRNLIIQLDKVGFDVKKLIKNSKSK